MADIRDKILKKYDIDIRETDLISLYKIPSADTSGKALEELFQKRRKNWTMVLNNSMGEKKTAQARIHLARADLYEAILRDDALRKELFAYSQKSSSSDEFIGFAREFFRIVASSKKIDDEDVQFFFDFYKGRVKNRKAVIHMLEQEFGLGKADSKKLDKEEEKEEEGKGKKEKREKKGKIIASLFKESTLKDIQNCENLLEEARKSPKVQEVFLEVQKPLAEVLHLDQYDTLEKFKQYVEGMRTAAANFRYENGQEFSPIVDIFNTMYELTERDDVACNYQEFTILVQYDRLNSYMYEILAPKEDTLRFLYETACKYYQFEGFYDFILKYFIPLYKNFGIYENSVKRLMKKAKRSGGVGGEVSVFSKIFGKEQEAKLPLFLEVLTGFMNLPLYLSFILYEALKAVAWRLRYLSPLALIPLLPWATRLFLIKMEFEMPVRGGEGTLQYTWMALSDALTRVVSEGALSILLFALFFIIVCGVPSALFIYSLWQAATKMRKKLDWLGIERTYQAVICSRRKAALERYKKSGQKAFSAMVFAAVMNVALVCAVCHGVSGPAAALGRYPGIISRAVERWAYERELESMMEAAATEEAEEETEEAEYASAVVAVDAANIRSGPGTDYGAVGGARRDDVLVLTGNSQDTGGGSVWYEVFLDPEMTQTGWISGSLLQIQ